MSAAMIPAAVGLAGTLLGGKGKENTYSAVQDATANNYRNMLYKYLANQMGGNAGTAATNDALSVLYSKFLPGLTYIQGKGATANTASSSNPGTTSFSPAYGTASWLTGRRVSGQ